jgi:hypothetical protein
MTPRSRVTGTLVSSLLEIAHLVPHKHQYGLCRLVGLVVSFPCPLLARTAGAIGRISPVGSRLDPGATVASGHLRPAFRARNDGAARAGTGTRAPKWLAFPCEQVYKPIITRVCGAASRPQRVPFERRLGVTYMTSDRKCASRDGGVANVPSRYYRIRVLVPSGGGANLKPRP